MEITWGAGAGGPASNGRSEGWFVVLGSAGTADEFALGQVEDDVSGLAVDRETCPVVASSVVAESNLAESGLAGQGVVPDVEGHLLAPWPGGAGANGAPVGFLVVVEHLVTEVFFEDADGRIAG